MCSNTQLFVLFLFKQLLKCIMINIFKHYLPRTLTYIRMKFLTVKLPITAVQSSKISNTNL